MHDARYRLAELLAPACRDGGAVLPPPRPVGLGNADQLADHVDRQRSCEVPQQVHRAALGVVGQVIEQALDDRLDPRPELGGAARGERGRHQPAQPRVLRPVHFLHGPHVRQAVFGYVRSDVTVGVELEPRVTQHRPGALVPRQGPHRGEPRREDPRQRRVLPGAPVGGKGVAQHLGVGQVDLGNAAHIRSDAGHGYSRFSKTSNDLTR